MRLILSLHRVRNASPQARTRRVRTSGPTPYERDRWAVIRNLRLANSTPPERRSFDRRPPYLGP
jgi:hypothetical protein